MGRHFLPKLKDLGYIVKCVDIKEGLDCRDFFRTNNIQFDLVVHLAAVVGGRQKIEGQPLSVAIDLSIDAEMFNWAARTKPGQVVYFSSSAAYPIELQTGKDKMYDRRLSEDDIDLNNIKQPDMTYGFAKLAGEMQADLLRKKGVNVYVFRPFSGYGSDQDLDYPFPSYIKRACDKRDPFEIWGDGLAQRDFIHIDDIVDQVLQVLDMSRSGYELPINLGTGIATNFRQLATMCCDAVGYKPTKVYYLENPVGVQRRVSASINLYEAIRPRSGEFTWEHVLKRTKLEDGIETAIKAYKDKK